jgi:hypothetical protein
MNPILCLKQYLFLPFAFGNAGFVLVNLEELRRVLHFLPALFLLLVLV